MVAAIAIAAIAVVQALWPDAWSRQSQLFVVVPLTIVSVLLIELEREAARRRAPQRNTTRQRRQVDDPTSSRPLTAVLSRLRTHARALRRHRVPDDPLEPADAPMPLPSPTQVAPFPPQGTFRGRMAEINALLAQHRDARAASSEPDLTGSPGGPGRPVLLLIHGKPGVGKSALALELARRLAEQYPDGHYYANLGNVGAALSAGEVLKNFLDALGWRNPLPGDTAERSKLLRALTATRRVLFVLDAAPDHQQVLDVLPSGVGCAVIVTSRRDLGPGLGATSWLLETPGTDEALDMLHAIAGTDDYAAPVCAAAIVERCGRLPVAIQAAGERVSEERAELCSVADLLENESLRLERLTRRGRDFADGIATEYRQLNGVEQRAFQMLTLVDSSTFQPWVLGPLLQIPAAEADKTVSRLASAQLVDVVSGPATYEQGRYRLHPLVRLFARQQFMADPQAAAAATAARRRLAGAYCCLMAQVLSMNDSGIRQCGPVDNGAFAGPELAVAIAGDPGPWIRAEHPNLAQCALHAYDAREWGVCWRVAAWLGTCFPERGSADRVLAAFDAGLDAADQDGAVAGKIDVLLAKAACLTAAERYPEAHEALREVLSRAADWARSDTAGTDPAHERTARAHLVLGEGYLQMRHPYLAERHLTAAHDLLNDHGTPDGLRLVGLLESLNFDVDSRIPHHELRRTTDERLRFWAMLELAEEERRRYGWTAAADCLDEARRCCTGDGRRTANVSYRQARLFLEEWRHGTDDARAHLARLAVRRATEAVLAFQRMTNPAGEVRARCLLARTLLAVPHPTAAAEQLVLAQQRLEQVARTGNPAAAPLRARIEWATGELYLHHGRRDEARTCLLAASQIFTELGDSRSRAKVVDLIGGIDRKRA
jgi:DNA polymerase III delta prime subunit